MKKILVLLTILIIITGCKNSDKFYLDDNCYKDGTYIEISKIRLKILVLFFLHIIVFVHLKYHVIIYLKL